jgi:hypothetical protein
MDDESALVSIAGWCLSGPGATLASELIVSDKESGSPSEGGGYINNFAALDKSAYDQAIQKVDELARDREGLEAELGKLGSKVKEEAGRAAQLESELVRLKADYASRMQPRSPFSAQPRAPSLSRFADSRQRPVSSFSGLERTGGVNGRGDEFKESGRSVYSVDSVELFSLRPIVDRLDESLDSIAKTEVRASKILKSTLLISYTSAAVLFLSLVVSFFFFFRTEGERPPAAEETAIPPEVRAPSMPRPSSIRIDNDRPSTDNFGSRESENKR